MRVVFMGSDRIACPALEALMDADWIDLAAVVTRPDKPRGRKRRLMPCAMKEYLFVKGFKGEIFTPEKTGDPDFAESIADLEPAVIVVMAYGRILKRAILDIPTGGCVNIHASLLPAYRGAAPVQWALINGEKTTGVTTMFMDEGIDTGRIILQEKIPIDEADTAGSLKKKLAPAGARLLLRTLSLIQRGEAVSTPQDENKSSIAPMLSKKDGMIDWSMTAEEIHNRVRGMNPWPCCRCILPDGSGLRVLRSRVEDCGSSPGTVADAGGAGPLVGAGGGCVRLLEVQPDGGKVMSGEAYLRGHALEEGDMFR